MADDADRTVVAGPSTGAICQRTLFALLSAKQFGRILRVAMERDDIACREEHAEESGQRRGPDQEKTREQFDVESAFEWGHPSYWSMGFMALHVFMALRAMLVLRRLRDGGTDS